MTNQYTQKKNLGPRITTFVKKPKSRSAANRVWVSIFTMHGRPPSWMRMIPPRRWIETDQGERVFTNTSRWEIGFQEDGPCEIVYDGKAKDVVKMIEGGV